MFLDVTIDCPHFHRTCVLRSWNVCAIYGISTMILCERFLCIEEFSKLACPTCPTYQPYISVGFIRDTFVDTVTCQVSKIKWCIRYDGWTATWCIWETNRSDVRFHLHVDWCDMHCAAGSMCLMDVMHMQFGCTCIACVICAIYVWYLPWFHERDPYA